MNKKSKKELSVKILALIVSVFSLFWGVFSSVKSKSLEDSNIMYKIEIARKSAELIQAEMQIRNQHKIIDSFQHSIDSLQVEKRKNKIIEDSLKNVLSYNTSLIDSLKSSLYENTNLPDITDDKHIELFLFWTDPRGHHHNNAP